MEKKIYSAISGLNTNAIPSQLKEGQLSYALNAVVKGFDGKSIIYQNEAGNTQFYDIPTGYQLVGHYSIVEKQAVVLFLAGSTSQIGLLSLVDGSYKVLISWKCLGFDINYPIHKVKHKVTSLGTEIYWTDNLNPMRYLNIDTPPLVVDCNLLNVLAKYNPVHLHYVRTGSDGQLISGAYQFGFQYAAVTGEPFSEYVAITNPISIHNDFEIDPNFNSATGKSIELSISGIDTTGAFDYYNIGVAKTINGVTSFELVGTYPISKPVDTLLYTGQGKSDIRLTAQDFFEQFARYEKANDVTTAQDILIWSDLTTAERLDYQSIFSKLHLQWVSYRLPHPLGENYKKPIHTANTKGYFRDEVYAFEGQFILDDGSFTDGFHIPGRAAIASDLEMISNADALHYSESECEVVPSSYPKWKVYNTASRLGLEQSYIQNMDDPCYTGPYEYGEFGYHQSTEYYPFSDSWGELAGQPIRHHRFPDSLVSHIHDNDGIIYPLGIKFNMEELQLLIEQSSLTAAQKARIKGVRILRADRSNSKSVVARGLIYNVGIYYRDDRNVFFPNYPYNDVRKDPFLTEVQSGNDSSGTASGTGEYTGTGFFDRIFGDLRKEKEEEDDGRLPPWMGGGPVPGADKNDNGIPDLDEDLKNADGQTIVTREDNGTNVEIQLRAFDTPESKKRYTFHSPDTHFYQPSLGNQLRLETIEHGEAIQHVELVKNHARYQLIRGGAYGVGLAAALLIGFASGQYGTATKPFDGTAAFTAFNATLEIIKRTLPRVNYAYQINGVGRFAKYLPIYNNGSKIRYVDLASYLVSGMTSVGDVAPINNFQRESAVYLRTKDTLPFPHEAGGPEDISRYTPGKKLSYVTKPISAYYATIKRNLSNQYGRLYTYNTIDTGFAYNITDTDTKYVFGGDCFINKFALKRKFPFFRDHRVGFPDESDIDCREVNNVAYANYWFSTDYGGDSGAFLKDILGVKINNFDDRTDRLLYQYGRYYLFNYGINEFFCESEVNVDLRQAYNSKEGEFYPHVGGDIPDEWLQEINVSINHDNTYHYNKSFSKQNKEKVHSHIPEDFDVLKDATRRLTNTAFYSEPQMDSVYYRRNNWRIYRPVSKFDFPLTYGKLTSLEGIENKEVLARFESKTLLYNSLVKLNTSAQAAYIGNDSLFRGAPPVDFLETDQGFAGSQHKFFLKTKNGKISVDARRAQILIIEGNSIKDLASEEFNCSSFFGEHLPFKIQEYFPDVNTDNHFNGIGLHGVYDVDGERFILTKLDYEPLYSATTHKNGEFFLNGKKIALSDPAYFCSRSFTASFSFISGSWVSFHSYLPKAYLGTEKNVYSYNGSDWFKHGFGNFHSFYGKDEPYILEYPIKSSTPKDDILGAVLDHTKVYGYNGKEPYVKDTYFNKCVLYNDQQCSGLTLLTKRDKNNLAQAISYPKFTSTHTEILYSKADNLYQFNSFWNIVKDPTKPFFAGNCKRADEKSTTDNFHYGINSYKKEALRGKDFKIRLILDNDHSTRMISQFLITEQQNSHR